MSLEKNSIVYTKNTDLNSQSNSYSSKKTISYDFSPQFNTGDIYTLAKAFLTISEMTNKKLQKLCYYAKGWYLALYDTNLVIEEFQAWVHGAVQPGLYQKYKVYGFDKIPKFINKSEIPEEFLDFANEIYNSYGHLTGDQLERLNHQEYPWLNARNNCQPWENSSTVISEDDMKIFFRGLIQNDENTEGGGKQNT